MLRIEELTLQLPYYRHWWQRDWTTCFDKISLTLAAGEIHAIVGASGAGKSLLAYTIFGLLPKGSKTSGRLFFQSEPLTPTRQKQLRGRQLALIPQSLKSLDPLVRSQHQVCWSARRAGHSKAASWQSTKQALAYYQLDKHAQRAFPHELSGGMARRVLTAMAHVSHADLIIADEPSVGLDPHQRDRVLAALKALASQGKAILLITHDLRHALPVANNVTIMRQGVCVETMASDAFQGLGDSLRSGYAKALWHALPDNGFTTSPIDMSTHEELTLA